MSNPNTNELFFRLGKPELSLSKTSFILFGLDSVQIQSYLSSLGSFFTISSCLKGALIISAMIYMLIPIPGEYMLICSSRRFPLLLTAVSWLAETPTTISNKLSRDIEKLECSCFWTRRTPKTLENCSCSSSETFLIIIFKGENYCYYCVKISYKRRNKYIVNL